MTLTHCYNMLLLNSSSGMHDGAGESDNPRLAPYVSMAIHALSDHGVTLEDRQRLTLIVEAALEGRTHFFAAALHDPDQEELDQFFMDFVLRCVVSPDERSHGN